MRVKATGTESQMPLRIGSQGHGNDRRETIGERATVRARQGPSSKRNMGLRPNATPKVSLAGGLMGTKERGPREQVMSHGGRGSWRPWELGDQLGVGQEPSTGAAWVTPTTSKPDTEQPHTTEVRDPAPRCHEHTISTGASCTSLRNTHRVQAREKLSPGASRQGWPQRSWPSWTRAPLMGRKPECLQAGRKQAGPRGGKVATALTAGEVGEDCTTWRENFITQPPPKHLSPKTAIPHLVMGGPGQAAQSAGSTREEPDSHT